MFRQQSTAREVPAGPAGLRLRPVWEKGWRTIIGVGRCKDYSFGPPEWVDGEIVPLTQATAVPQNLALVTRVGNDPPALEQALPRIIRRSVRDMRGEQDRAMDALVSRRPRRRARWHGWWGLYAARAGTAAAGIYGVVVMACCGARGKWACGSRWAQVPGRRPAGGGGEPGRFWGDSDSLAASWALVAGWNRCFTVWPVTTQSVSRCRLSC